MSKAMWVVQVLLAALFVFAGVMKFVMPVAVMAKQAGLPGWFMHFIAAAEVCGGLGLVLPGLVRIRPGLTPLAAAGLVPIMIGATVVTLRIAPPSQAALPALCGLLAAWLAWGRWRVAPLRSRA
jgi:uncharacterized membrane protein YphA (DoxX/SURF4 family)